MTHTTTQSKEDRVFKLLKLTSACFLTSLALGVSIAHADNDPDTLAPYYIGGTLNYNLTADANPTLKRKKQPIGFGFLFGYKQPFNEYSTTFIGYELQFSSLGSDKWTSGNTASPSAQYMQLNALAVFHYMPLRHLDITLKSGVAWQLIQVNNMSKKGKESKNTSWFTLPVIGAGVGVYVSEHLKLGANWLYTFGDGDGKAAHGSHDTIANNQFAVALTYHF